MGYVAPRRIAVLMVFSSLWALFQGLIFSPSARLFAASARQGGEEEDV